MSSLGTRKTALPESRQDMGADKAFTGSVNNNQAGFLTHGFSRFLRLLIPLYNDILQKHSPLTVAGPSRIFTWFSFTRLSQKPALDRIFSLFFPL